MKPKLLVHICCAPCSLRMIQELKNDFDVIGLWSNPNIQPADEYQRRKESVDRLSTDDSFVMIDDEPANTGDWYRRILQAKHFGKERCTACYLVRLSKTLAVMSQMRIDYFTSTLLASPHQNHDMIKQIGEKIGKKHFVYKDFRGLYYESKNTAYRCGYYLQKYCGCLESKAERDMQKKSRSLKRPDTRTGLA